MYFRLFNILMYISPSDFKKMNGNTTFRNLHVQIFTSVVDIIIEFLMYNFITVVPFVRSQKKKQRQANNLERERNVILCTN